jgi:beta-lactamase regulating signal transducer with metallopeptidase domain
MIPGLELENLRSWMEQTLVVASIGAALPALFRIQHPRTQLVYGHAILAICLLLPLLQPWRHAPLSGASASFTAASSRTPAGIAQSARQKIQRKLPGRAPASRASQGSQDFLILLPWILGIGLAARLGWLCVGLWQIRNQRIRSTPVYPIPEAVKAACALTHADALICTSPDACGPVTLGWLAPVVLLPDSALKLAEEGLCAVLCHELLHVKRHDWLIAIFEELAGALLWFNPAAWWLLAQIRLAREQLVDAESVRLTEAREPYIQSLLSIARTGPMLDLAPAPLFLRKRHLTQRLHLLLKEVSMSNARLLSSYGSIAALAAAAGWLACASFPLVGQPQGAANQAASFSPQTGEPYGVLQGNHYHHNLSGVEFELPAGWSLGHTGPADGDPVAMTTLIDPDGKTIFASVFMKPANTPAASIPGALDRAIPGLLVRRGAPRGVHAALNYRIREGSEQHTWINGNQALRAIGENEQGNQKLVEFLTWIYTEHTRVYFFARTTLPDEDSVQITFDQLLQSAKIP